MLGDVIEVDVLINKSGKISWTLTNNSVPKNAIEGGKLNENKKIYICRVKDGSDNVGWVIIHYVCLKFDISQLTS
ncbi:hypothetical protein PV326_012384 [Microctonus aethiopoides]|nr:hypothetical protein PV326_012384 [Microctonus aethiopoides]